MTRKIRFDSLPASSRLLAGAVAGIVALTVTGAVVADSHGEKAKTRAAQQFSAMDANGDGKLTREEMKAHHKARHAKKDTNGDGKISRDEFKKAGKSEWAARADRMFDNMDRDGDGFLTDADKPKDKDMDKRRAAMFDKMDKDGDGAISRDEAESARMFMRHHMKKKRGHDYDDHDDDDHSGHYGHR
ncbi:MAG: EF-hand domain-containing protein [Alphaproteobacteria bacterium]